MTYTTYTPSGPFINNNPPGISAAALNNIETFASAGWFDSLITSDGSGNETVVGLIASTLKVNQSGTTITGTTNGSATLYQFLQGTVKGFVIYFNAYRNNTTTEQTISLPVAFTTGALFLVGASKSIRPYLSGSATTGKVNVVSTISNGSTAGGTTNGNATQGYSYGDVQGGFDAVGLGTSEASTSTGLALFIGI